MGNWCSTMSLSIPETMALSTGLTEEARTRTSTSFGAVCGVGISCRVGLVSKLSRMMARIVSFSSLGCLLCLTLHGGIYTRVTYTRLQNLSSIHRSAWKGNSANFVFTAFSEVASGLVSHHTNLVTCQGGANPSPALMGGR